MMRNETRRTQAYTKARRHDTKARRLDKVVAGVLEAIAQIGAQRPARFSRSRGIGGAEDQPATRARAG